MSLATRSFGFMTEMPCFLALFVSPTSRVTRTAPSASAVNASSVSAACLRPPVWGSSVVSCSLKRVAERLGDTPEMVLKVYGHIMPDSEDRTRRAIDAAWTTDGLQTASGVHRMS
jgi:hypothetical protein